MKVLGLRCGNAGYSYVVLEGKRNAATLIASGSVISPRGFASPPRLGWMRHEITDLCKKYTIDAICMKGSEGLAARGAAFVGRTEMEAIVYLVGQELGIKPVNKKVKSTLARDLGQKGKGKYLGNIDLAQIDGFADLDEKGQEAGFAAWSQLP